MTNFKWEIKYNNQSTGKMFFTKKECKQHWQNLWDKGLYGYTINKIEK